jgi:hypothetical protein
MTRKQPTAVVPAEANTPEDGIRLQCADFIRIGLFAALSGYTPEEVRQKIEENLWRQGFEYVRAPDGCLLIDVAGYKRWARGERR